MDREINFENEIVSRHRREPLNASGLQTVSEGQNIGAGTTARLSILRGVGDYMVITACDA